MFFRFFFCNIIKVNQFLYRFITLLHSISSFSPTRSFLVPYHMFLSNQLIFLSSYEFEAILSISSVKTYFSLLNTCCGFNINSLFLMNSLCFLLQKRSCIRHFYFFPDGLICSQVELLLSSFYSF